MTFFKALFFNNSTYASLFLLLAEISAALTVVCLSLVLAGFLIKGRVWRNGYELLIFFSVPTILATLVSQWLSFAVGSNASMQLCESPTPWNCDLIQGESIIGLYFLPNLSIPLMTLVYGVASLVS